MSFVLLMVAFILSGALNTAGKALVEWDLGEYITLYLLAFYSTGMIFGFTIMSFQRKETTPKDRSIGLLMGFCGAGAMLFMLLALEHLPGIIVFPVRNLGNLVLIGMFSLVVWKDRLSIYQWLGIGVSLIAMYLIY